MASGTKTFRMKGKLLKILVVNFRPHVLISKKQCIRCGTTIPSGVECRWNFVLNRVCCMECWAGEVVANKLLNGY